jgi:L-lactate dehydrogenase complex protein LldG
MSTAREILLGNVRKAVKAGNRAGDTIPHPTRGNVGYQGGGPDPIGRFCDEFIAAGGIPHIVEGSAGAAARVLELVKKHQPQCISLGRGAIIDSLHLDAAVRALNVQTLFPGADRDLLFKAEMGVTGVDALVVETGTIVQFSRPDQPRLISLLPPIYIAVADRSQLVPDLFDWFDSIPSELLPNDLPACLSLITGPSKTGDIELRLVTGVHGPGEVHVVLINA